jgi:hypothetical protein
VAALRHGRRVAPLRVAAAADLILINVSPVGAAMLLRGLCTLRGACATGRIRRHHVGGLERVTV